MATLREILLRDEEKQAVVLADVRDLLDREVKSKRGIKGLAVKTGYKVVKTFKRGFLEKVVEHLVPDFCDALEPLHAEHLESSENGQSFGRVMKSRESEVTAALLTVTDGKARLSKNKVVKRTYAKLRPAAERNVREAVPGLADVMDRHYGK